MTSGLMTAGKLDVRECALRLRDPPFRTVDGDDIHHCRKHFGNGTIAASHIQDASVAAWSGTRVQDGSSCLHLFKGGKFYAVRAQSATCLQTKMELAIVRGGVG